MAYSSVGEMAGRGRKNEFNNDNIQMGPPPMYQVDADGTLAPHWWDLRSWTKKQLLLAGLGVVIIVAIVIVIAVVVSKKNEYPNYSQINYTLKDTFSGTSFFDNFDYFTGYDPTDGFVHYLLADQQTTYSANTTYASSTSAILRVDDTQNDQTTGRYSARVTSKNQYNDGLFVFDVLHTPYGCATWPALWLSDPSNWPTNGEIDVMEAVNNASTGNQMTLHTTNDCKMSVKRKETGKVLESNCYNGTDGNAGCGVQGATDTFGEEFNTAGGGVMAMELRSAGIRMWQFGRSSIPSDITAETPDPSTWGEALADFPSTDCDIGSHFKNQSIIVNIDVCGTWAGATSVYTDEDNCPSTCTDYAANNPTAFTNAYWEFSSFKVYQSS